MSEIFGADSSETLRGSAGDDQIRSGDGEDTVYGNEGDDWINAIYDDDGDASYYLYSGSLTAYGGPGDDLIGGKEGDDRLFGGPGNDRIWGRGGNDRIEGGEGEDILFGGEGDNTIFGNEGNDRIQTRDGADTVYGNEGDDWINAYYDDDGDDRYYFYAGSLTAYGGIGDDLISGKEGDNLLVGGPGNDRILGRDGNDRLEGGEGDDFLRGGDGEDTIYGGAGDDWINARYNYAGDDRYYVYSGPVTAYGGPGDDLVGGTKGDDRLEGGADDDYIYAWAGADMLDGGSGDDVLNGADGDDTLLGGLGDDELLGGNGDDVLYGGAGDDELRGGDGDDTLYGSSGKDRLRGGHGDDTYHVRSLNDNIRDSAGNDTAIVSVSFAKIPSYIENVEYVGGALLLPYWIDALLPDAANGSSYSRLLGDNKTFRYVFPSRAPSYADAKESKGYQPLSSTQRNNALTVLEYLESIIDVSFVGTANPDQPNTIAIALNEQENSGGYARYPSSASTGSDVLLNDASYNATLNAGTYGANVLVHELGHALGLKHPFDDPDTDGDIADPPYLRGAEDHARWTMMSYTETSAEYKLTFSELDIAALQYLYGPSASSRTGDDTYVYKPGSANFIWDGAGDDTIDASGSPASVTIYLEPGYHGFNGLYGKSELITARGQITVNFGSEIENLIGSDSGDSLTGNRLDNFIEGRAGDDAIYGKEGNDALAGGAGDDYAQGGVGNDELMGGDGADTLHGGSGNDRIEGGAGSDILRGGSGLDYAIYDGDKDQYAISANGDSIVISALATASEDPAPEPDRDELASIERISFADINLAFDFGGNAGKAARALGAFLGLDGVRNASLAGYVLNLLDMGMAYEDLLRTAVDTIFGTGPDGPRMVRYFHKVLTGEEAPDDVAARWGGMIDAGELSALELASLVADDEQNLANIDFSGLAATGLEYLAG